MAIDLARMQAPARAASGSGPPAPERRAAGAGRALVLEQPGLARSRAACRSTSSSLFTQQLALLLRRGNAIVPSMRRPRRPDARPRCCAAICARVHQRLEAGGQLSEALKSHPRPSTRLYVSIVRAGEATGELRLSLESLAAILEIRRRLRALPDPRGDDLPGRAHR